MGGNCFFKFVLQRNSWAKKGGSVDQDMRHRGLVLRKITSPEDRMMSCLGESLEGTLEAVLKRSSRTRVAGGGGHFGPGSLQDWGSGSLSKESNFISAIGVGSPWLEKVRSRALAGLAGILGVTGKQGGDMLRPHPTWSTMILPSPLTGSEGSSAPGLHQPVFSLENAVFTLLFCSGKAVQGF